MKEYIEAKMKEFQDKFTCAGACDETRKMMEESISQLITDTYNKGVKDTEEKFEELLSQVSKVYFELTNGKFSKPTYLANVIIDEVNEIWSKDLDENYNKAIENVIEICEKRIIDLNRQTLMGNKKSVLISEAQKYIKQLNQLRQQ